MPAPSLAVLCGRGVLATALLAGLAYVNAEALMAPLLPFMAFVIDSLQGSFLAHLWIAVRAGTPMIVMSAITRVPVALSATQVLPAYTQLDGGATHVLHALLPLVMHASVLLGWPVAGLREAGLRLLTGILALLPVLILTTPVLLAGRVCMMLAGATANQAGSSPVPFLGTLFLFMESGGRWLLPLLCGSLAVGAAGWLAKTCAGTTDAGQPRQT